ncbi:MAG: alpha/beta fold hydrolase [Chloroflexi bacterium]|nr:alpha/beta fold hydrolase [Chloroflexota bacterium]
MMRRPFRNLMTLAGGYLAVQGAFAFLFIASRNVRETLTTQENRGFPGSSLFKTIRYKRYTVTHEIDQGIERITYTPHERKHETPIVMQHGMWHGAWCWERWQRILAEHGWQSHAHSLPGHALSPAQRPIHLCTLDYYLSFLKREIDRCDHRPILMGHSMGGALAQWAMKYVDDALPAVVLVGPWASHSVLDTSLDITVTNFWNLIIETSLTWSASCWVNSPERAAEALISANADITPEDLYARLGPESALVLLQHNPPFWTPADQVRSPVLLVAGALDKVCPAKYMETTARHYRADYFVDPNSGHNLMMDGDFAGTGLKIHEWLEAQTLP